LQNVREDVYIKKNIIIELIIKKIIYKTLNGLKIDRGLIKRYRKEWVLGREEKVGQMGGT
jgi:hypothetical protein